MLKDLFELVKMLFITKPSDYDDVVLKSMSYFPFTGYRYMMWCGNIVYRKSKEESVMERMNTEQGIVDKNHERIHLYQAKAKGSWLSYYFSYFIEWLKGKPWQSPCNSAYYTIPYEMEAYANESNLDYTSDYAISKMDKYIIDGDRKELYNQQGKSSYKWKQYVKTL